MTSSDHPILLTGATGYVGGQLLRALEQKGCRVRCLVQNPQSVSSCVSSTTEVVQGNVLDQASLQTALEGVETAYYLVYKAASSGPFQDDARRAAVSFAAAARQAGVRRIIYLGGLGGKTKYSGQPCGPQEIGGILRESGAQVIEFRTSVIVGAGSLAFEMARTIAEKFSVLGAPRWMRRRTKPIAIEDVTAYLVAALEADVRESAVFEIGGADTASFSDLVQEYARQRGLKRLRIPLPLLMPRLSILWLAMVAPKFARIGQELVATLCGRRSLGNSHALEVFPVRPRGIREAVERALSNEGGWAAPANRLDALAAPPLADEPREVRFGPRIVDSRTLWVPYPPALAFRPIERIGGKTGWYYADWLWKLRGWIDVMLGGVGKGRGRPDPERLSVGDPVDFWRVEAMERNRLLRLAAEMKLPGSAWLQFEVEENKQGPPPALYLAGWREGSTIRQLAVFDPIGFSGLLYWYVFYPAHEFIFPGMLRGIGRVVARSAAAKPPEA